MQKRQKDWLKYKQVLTKDFRSYKINQISKVFEKKKATQLAKPINYSKWVKPINQATIPANTCSN